MFNGKINYFDWAIFNSKLFVYQRVTVCELENHQAFSGISTISMGHVQWQTVKL